MVRIVDGRRVMRQSFRFILASMLASAVLVPATAFAGEEAAPKAEDSSRDLKGFELMLRPSFGGGGSDSPVRFQPDAGAAVQGDPGALLQGASPWGAGFVGQATFGYRFLPFLSAGLRGGIRTASGSNLSDGSQNLSRTSWDAGFYVRAYPLAGVESVSKYIDPWIGTGVMYMRDMQSLQRGIPVSGGGSVLGDVSLDHHAVAIPIGVGVDYRVTRFLSLGPSFEYTLANAAAACAKTSAAGFQGSTFCSNESPGSSFIKAKNYGVWSAGLEAKLTF